MSRKRIQDYIRHLNRSEGNRTNLSNLPATEVESTVSENSPSEDLQSSGLLLQVIDNFVTCTVDSIDKRIEQIRTSNINKSETIDENLENTYGMFEVMKNVRQFISGVKNYLIKTGEGDLHTIMQEERNKVLYKERLKNL